MFKLGLCLILQTTSMHIIITLSKTSLSSDIAAYADFDKSSKGDRLLIKYCTLYAFGVHSGGEHKQNSVPNFTNFP